MKKIIRLVCVVFILLLLFYATNFVNECRQMRDVFNSFVVVENPSSSKQCSVINDTLRQSYDFLHFLDNPRPLWIDLGGYYVYSAFWSSESKSDIAVALGLGPVSDPKYDCSVWFEYENIVSSVRGRFSFETSSWNSSVSLYKFICAIDENDIRGEPNILVFSSVEDGHKKKYHIPIFTKTLPTSNKTAICVRPDPAGIGKADIIEFISFHLLIGTTDLVLYGNEIHNSIIHKIRQLVGASNFLRSVSVLPWNFPYDDASLELKLIRLDCEYRTFGVAKAFAVLEWDQYIVPNMFKPISEIIKVENDKIPLIVNAKSQLCCLESVDDKRSEISWPVILKKTYCMDFQFDTFIKIHGEKVADESIFLIKDYNSSLFVKTYRSCVGLKNVKTKYDHSPFKFLSGLLSSELLRLWNTGSML